jgi:hypothetical protein
MMMLALLYPIAFLQAAAIAAPPEQADQREQTGQAVPNPSSACSSTAHRAFDFWIGRWEVFTTGTDTKVGDNVIEAISGGCAIRETWTPLQGEGGTSLSLVNHRSGRWEQTWIASDGVRVDLTGAMAGQSMVLGGYWDNLGGPGKDALVRITLTPQADGSVRQTGEASADHGKSWNAFFDLTYRVKPG